MKCTVCGAEFEYPDFGPCKKKPGKHRVAVKVYVHAGSAEIQNIRDRRYFSPVISLVADSKQITPAGTIVTTPHLSVAFADARYVTEDPEEQYHLDSIGHPIYSGEEGQRIWTKNQLTPPQQVELQKAEIAENNRLIKEQNELLEKIKKAKQPKAVPVA